MAAPQVAVRFVAGPRKSSLGSLHLHLYVKPGTSKAREGITAVTESAIELCVTAQPRDGEANQAVLELLSKVLDVPRTRFELAQGSRSKDKTVLLRNVNRQDAGTYVQNILSLLNKAAG